MADENKGIVTKSLTAQQKKLIDRVILAKESGEEPSKDDNDIFIRIFMNNPLGISEYLRDEDKISLTESLLNSPEARQRALDLEKSRKVQNNLATAIDLFNEGYNFYLAKEQQRVGKEELAQVQEAQVPGKVAPIPELEDAIRRARQLGDPASAIGAYQQAAERSQLGAVRAAQLGSRGQAGALGSQLQAIHQAKLAQDAQLPLIATDIRARGLGVETPLIGQKQAIELANRDAAVSLFPDLMRRQILQEQMAGYTLQKGLEGAQGVISRLPSKIPNIVGNMYANKYSDLPPELASILTQQESRYNYGQ